MKTNKKISSFIGGLLIAFSIALFAPTTAQATGNHCTTSTKCDIYKQKAQKYLEYYYRYYNYKYYQCYLYYMKKHDLCKSYAATICNKYKIYADKYLAAYNKCGHYCYYKYYQYYLNLYNQCKANLNQEGQVCGQVFEDTNGNGTQDTGEPFYAGAIAIITNANGNTQTSTTNTNGKYCADVPAGTTRIVIDSASLPAGSTITTEAITIDVEAGRENDAGKVGFEPAVTVGEVCGLVLLDGIGEENVTVSIVDASGNTHGATTDARGKYCISGIAEGYATVTVDETTLPAGVTLDAGENPDPIHVIASEIKYVAVSYATPIIRPGSICGLVMKDTNQDGGFDNDDEGIEGVAVTITDAGDTIYNRETNASGAWCVDSLSAGYATIDINESTLPDGAVRAYGSDLDTPFIVADTHMDAEPDGFRISQVNECPANYQYLEMEVFTEGHNAAANLQTVLPIDFPLVPFTVTFVNVRTGDVSADEQPNEQFKIVAVDQNDIELASTDYTTDIDNATLEDELSDLGTIGPLVPVLTKNILLVHKADPMYGEDIPSENSVTFKSLCYKVVNP